MTIQTDILAAMVHRSGAVPWLCSEISFRIGRGICSRTVATQMSGLKSIGLVAPVHIPDIGASVGWMLTPAGLAAIPNTAERQRPVRPAKKCGGPQDVARIMAADGVGHQDAYRLSIMRSDPAYHPGNRLPKFNPQTIQNGGSTVRKAIIARLTDEWQPFSAFADLGSKDNVVELLRELSVAGVLERSIHRANTPNGQSAYRLERKCP